MTFTAPDPSLMQENDARKHLVNNVGLTQGQFLSQLLQTCMDYAGGCLQMVIILSCSRGPIKDITLEIKRPGPHYQSLLRHKCWDSTALHVATAA